jgi:hypothetical protein
MDASLQGSGKQVGDPVRGCEAIIKAVEEGTPHLRLLLGKIALNFAGEKLEAMKENFNYWKDLTLSADFPEEQ